MVNNYELADLVCSFSRFFRVVEAFSRCADGLLSVCCRGLCDRCGGGFHEGLCIAPPRGEATIAQNFSQRINGYIRLNRLRVSS